MKLFSCICIYLLLSTVAAAQPAPSNLPRIVFESETVELQTSLYPTYYQYAAATDDIQWLRTHLGELQAFWQQYGDSVLEQLGLLGGIGWVDEDVDFRLLRYYPTLGSAEPLIMPVGGIRVGALTEAVPAGAGFDLLLTYALAQRLIWQGMRGTSEVAFGLANHPLAQPGPYYRDMLALHLALAALTRVLGPDSATTAYESSFWQRHVSGRTLYEQYIRNRWQLTEEKPLVAWLANEPYDSKLVQAAAPLARAENPQETIEQSAIEGVPPAGSLGFSLSRNSSGQLVVDKIDQKRRAYRAGLRAGDIINRVAGQRIQSYRELIETLLDNLERGPVTLSVSRNGKNETVVIRK